MAAMPARRDDRPEPGALYEQTQPARSPAVLPENALYEQTQPVRSPDVRPENALPRLAPSPSWTMTSVGSRSVAVAERDALGTTARLVIWPPGQLRPALGAVDSEISRLDLAASRFRPDSEISLVQARANGDAVPISASLAEVVGVALAAARWTGGLVDPTVGAAIEALGYDRDFVLIDDQPDLGPEPVVVPGWRCLGLDAGRLRLPAGIKLDFGATAKGLGADWAAEAATAVLARGGVLVSLGGDVRAGGEAPSGGWPVLVADEHREPGRSARFGSPTQVVRLLGGAIATSSITCRQWRRAGTLLHHIIDPRTGRPAGGPWRTVSVAAATCAEANAAATAAIIGGADAEGWLADRNLPARLVHHDGSVLTVAGWPSDEGGALPIPSPRMPRVTRARGLAPTGERSVR